METIAKDNKTVNERIVESLVFNKFNAHTK